MYAYFVQLNLTKTKLLKANHNTRNNPQLRCENSLVTARNFLRWILKKSQVGFLKKLLAVQFHLGQDFLAGVLVHLDAEEYQDYKADSSQ